MARLLVSGYYGFGNAGDEAILNALAAALPEHELTVLSGAPAATRREHRVAAVRRQHPLDVAAAIRRSDLVLSGGGSLLQDATGPRSVPYYLGVLWLAARLGRPFMVYAQGVGPVGSPGRLRMLRFLNRARYITVRDEASAELLRRVGVKDPPLEVTADAAFSLPAPSPEAGAATLAAVGLPTTRPVFGLSVRPWRNDGFLTAVAAAADGLLRRFGGQVVLLPMQVPEDLAACEAVRAHMREPASVLARRLPTPDLLRLFAAFDLVVGMRLHALIFAALARVMPAGLSYDPKVDAFLESIGAPPALQVGDLRGEDLLTQLSARFPAGAQAQELLAQRVAALRTAARRNHEIVRSLLG